MSGVYDSVNYLNVKLYTRTRFTTFAQVNAIISTNPAAQMPMGESHNNQTSDLFQLNYGHVKHLLTATKIVTKHIVCASDARLKDVTVSCML